MRLFARLSLRCAALFGALLFLMVPASACRTGETETPEETGGPDAPAIQTRQEFYYEVYRKILNDEILRGVYLPSRTRSGAADLLCGENLYEPGTYRYRVYARKRESASRMTVETLKYGYADNAVPRQRWIWRAPENSVALWSGLLSDFAEVDEKNREAVAFLCDAGLARIQEDTSAYLLRLGPNEPVTAEEAEALSAAVDSYVRAIPGNAVRTCDPEGNDILLCFSDPVSLFAFRGLITRLHGSGEIDRSFVYYDETGTVLSLWISSASGGMVSIPLDLAFGAVCALPYAGDCALFQQRLEIAAAILPENQRAQFLSDMTGAREGTDGSGPFYYEIEGSGCSIWVSVAENAGSAGTIRIGIAANQ